MRVKLKGIRIKLLLAFAFAVCPIMIIYGWTQGQAYMAARHVASSHHRQYAAFVAWRISAYIDRLASVHDTWAGEFASGETAPELAPVLIKWLDYAAGGDSVSIWIDNASRRPLMRRGSFSAPVISGLLRSADMPAYFDMTTRIRFKNGRYSRIVTHIPGPALVSKTPTLQKSLGWNVCALIDTSGKALILRRSSRSGDGASIAELVDVGRTMVRSDRQTARSGRYALASADVKGTKWKVLVIEDEAGIFDAFRRQHRWYEAAFLLGLAGLLTLYAVGNKLSRRIRRLAHAASAMAVGDYRRRIQMDTHDELSALADSFNNLGESLAKHEAEMRTHAELATRLADAARESSSSLDLRQCAKNIAAATCKHFGARDAAVFRRRPNGQIKTIGVHGRRCRSDWRLVAAHTCQSGEYLLMTQKPTGGEGSEREADVLLVGIPLAGATGPMGAIVATFDQTFHRDDLRPGSLRGDLMRAFGIHAAAAIANAEVYSETEKVSDALRDSVRRLASVVEVTDAIAPSLTLEDTLAALATTTTTLMAVDDCAILLPDKAGWLVARGTSDVQGGVRTGTRIRPGEGLTGEAYAEVRSVSSADAKRGKNGFGKGLADAAGFSGVLSTPLVAEDEAVGAITVFTLQPRRFSAAEVELLEAIAKHAAFIVRNAGLYTRESMIAEALQGSLIPQVPDRWQGLTFASRYLPMLEEARLGGDFFDVTPLPNGTVAVLIADVSGKGLEAAVHLAACKYMLKALAHIEPDAPEVVLDRLNKAMNYYFQLSFFVTVFYAIIDPARRTITYASAGHLPGLLVTDGGKVQTALPGTGLPVGVGQTCDYLSNTVTAQSGDVLLLYTDGYTDLYTNGAYLGVEGLREIVFGADNMSADGLVDHLVRTAQERPDMVRRDDIALLAVEFTDEAAEAEGVSGGKHVGRHNLQAKTRRAV